MLIQDVIGFLLGVVVGGFLATRFHDRFQLAVSTATQHLHDDYNRLLSIAHAERDKFFVRSQAQPLTTGPVTSTNSVPLAVTITNPGP